MNYSASEHEISPLTLQEVLTKRHGIDAQNKFQNSVVGIAGLGGLGSHVATFLARLGVGKLILADFDFVDISNIHRQNYTLEDINLPKTKALKQYLNKINPHLIYESHQIKLTEQNIPEIFAKSDIICEAFDEASQKAMLTACVLEKMPNVYLVGANGMAGIGSPNKIIAKKRFNRYFLCGDNISSVEEMNTLFAPRVALCAAKQATVIMQLILGELSLEF